MRVVTAILLVVASLALSCLGEVRLLIVDQTETIEESIRLEALARGLWASGAFAVRTMLEWPDEPWEEEPFHLILVLPSEGPEAWLCSPGPVDGLPDGLQLAYHGLADGVDQAFEGKRTVRGLGDSLQAWSMAISLHRLGYLIGAGG